MHLAKGLEFRAVVVMACDDEVIPLQERVEAVTDDADIEEVYNTERNLLYVACTRARDRLLVTSAEPGSEFLDDLKLKYWLIGLRYGRQSCQLFQMNMAMLQRPLIASYSLRWVNLSMALEL